MKKNRLTTLLETLVLSIRVNNDLLNKLIELSLSNNESPDRVTSEIYLNSKEVCSILKCSSVTLWKLRKNKEIRFTKLNNTIRFKQSDVYQYLKG